MSFPQDQIIELGDTVQLECVVSGDPEPVTEWVKDGEQIVLGMDEFVTFACIHLKSWDVCFNDEANRKDQM